MYEVWSADIRGRTPEKFDVSIIEKKGDDLYRRLFGVSVKPYLLALRFLRARNQRVNDSRVGKG